MVLRRPDPQALWRRRLSSEAWNAAHLVFERDPTSGGQRGRWRCSPQAPDQARGPAPRWNVPFGEAVCIVRPTPFKHVGLFPEQAANRAWFQAPLDQPPMLLSRTRNCCCKPLMMKPVSESAMKPPLAYCGPAVQESIRVRLPPSIFTRRMGAAWETAQKLPEA